MKASKTFHLIYSEINDTLGHFYCVSKYLNTCEVNKYKEDFPPFLFLCFLGSTYYTFHCCLNFGLVRRISEMNPRIGACISLFVLVLVQ